MFCLKIWNYTLHSTPFERTKKNWKRTCLWGNKLTVSQEKSILVRMSLNSPLLVYLWLTAAQSHQILLLSAPILANLPLNAHISVPIQISQILFYRMSTSSVSQTCPSSSTRALFWFWYFLLTVMCLVTKFTRRHSACLAFWPYSKCCLL